MSDKELDSATSELDGELEETSLDDDALDEGELDEGALEDDDALETFELDEDLDDEPLPDEIAAVDAVDTVDAVAADADLVAVPSVPGVPGATGEVALGPAPSADGAPVEDEEDVLDLDEELHPDDVEAPLDALLQERTASATLEDEEEELEDEDGDADERGEGPTRIVPRRPGEFLCSSCFLVLPRSQLADAERMRCRDCV